MGRRKRGINVNKKIIALVVVLMLFAGVVSASSINGDYKGNPIVKVTSKGKQLEVDEVPAHIIDGHTLVPISLLRQLGASVTWDTNSYTVDVKLPTPSGGNQQSSVSTGDVDNDINLTTTKNLIKIYNDIQKLRFFIILTDQAAHLANVNSLVSYSVTSYDKKQALVEVDRINTDLLNIMLTGAKKWEQTEYKDFETIVNAINKAKDSLYEFDVNSSRSQWIIAQSTLNSLYSRVDSSALDDLIILSPYVLDSNVKPKE